MLDEKAIGMLSLTEEEVLISGVTVFADETG